MDYSKAVIARIVNSNGKRLGARLFFPDGTIKNIKAETIIKLGEYLTNTNTKLQNATITVDGRIYPRANQTVETYEVRVPRKEVICKDEDYTPKHTSRDYPSYTIVRGDESFFPPSFIRLSKLVEEGLRLAHRAGVDIEVLEATRKIPRGSKYPYMTVSIKSIAIYEFSDIVTLEVYTDGAVFISDHGNIDLRTYPLYTNTLCRTPEAIATTLCYFADLAGTPVEYDEELWKQTQEETDITLRKNKYKALSSYTYPLRPLRESLDAHIYNFEQLARELNTEFFGRYPFRWDIKEREAKLYVTLYDSSKIYATTRNERERIFSSLCDRKPLLLTEEDKGDAKVVSEVLELRLILHSSNFGNYVSLDHRVLTQERRWVKLQEHKKLWFVSNVCNAVQYLAEEVIQHSITQESIRVLSVGLIDGEYYYLTTLGAEPIHETALMELCKYCVVEGIVFTKNPVDGAPKLPPCRLVVSPLPKFIKKGKNIYIYLVYDFFHENSDKLYSLSTAVVWEDYIDVINQLRPEQVEVKEPKQLVGDLLVKPTKQINSLIPLIHQLQAKLPLGHTPREGINLITSFIRTQFRYTPLQNIVKAYSSPLELLLNPHGCCLDLSVLTALLLALADYDSAVFIRYAPELESRFHAVSAVRADRSNRDYQNNPPNSVGERSIKYEGYLPVEPTKGELGKAEYWGDYSNDDYATNNTTITPSQVSLVPVEPDGGVTKQLLLQGNSVVPVTRDSWNRVKEMFQK